MWHRRNFVGRHTEFWMSHCELQVVAESLATHSENDFSISSIFRPSVSESLKTFNPVRSNFIMPANHNGKISIIFSPPMVWPSALLWKFHHQTQTIRNHNSNPTVWHRSTMKLPMHKSHHTTTMCSFITGALQWPSVSSFAYEQTSPPAQDSHGKDLKFWKPRWKSRRWAPFCL